MKKRIVVPTFSRTHTFSLKNAPCGCEAYPFCEHELGKKKRADFSKTGKVRLHLTLPEARYRKLKEVSKQTGLSMSELVRMAIQMAIRELNKEE